eukprot:m.61432 g.61432  ORF g.61432 m.61432 type:complete len:618 (+) comp11866_c0_seq1:34-1887(+)
MDACAVRCSLPTPPSMTDNAQKTDKPASGCKLKLQGLVGLVVWMLGNVAVLTIGGVMLYFVAPPDSLDTSLHPLSASALAVLVSCVSLYLLFEWTKYPGFVHSVWIVIPAELTGYYFWYAIVHRKLNDQPPIPSVRLIMIALIVSLRLMVHIYFCSARLYAKRDTVSGMGVKGLTHSRWLVDALRHECEEKNRTPWVHHVLDLFGTLFLLCGAIAYLICTPIYIALSRGREEWVGSDVFGATLCLLATFADIGANTSLRHFLSAHNSSHSSTSTHTRPTYDSGLWYLSRHPNYFLFWLFWVSIFVIGVGAPQDLAERAKAVWTLLGVLLLLLYFHWIPIRLMENKQLNATSATSSYYKEYMTTTSQFIPMTYRAMVVNRVLPYRSTFNCSTMCCKAHDKGRKQSLAHSIKLSSSQGVMTSDMHGIALQSMIRQPPYQATPSSDGFDAPYSVNTTPPSSEGYTRLSGPYNTKTADASKTQQPTTTSSSLALASPHMIDVVEPTYANPQPAVGSQPQSNPIPREQYIDSRDFVGKRFTLHRPFGFASQQLVKGQATVAYQHLPAPAVQLPQPTFTQRETHVVQTHFARPTHPSHIVHKTAHEQRAPSPSSSTPIAVYHV